MNPANEQQSRHSFHEKGYEYTVIFLHTLVLHCKTNPKEDGKYGIKLAVYEKKIQNTQNIIQGSCFHGQFFGIRHKICTGKNFNIGKKYEQYGNPPQDIQVKNAFFLG